MSISKVEFFRLYLDTIPAIEEIAKNMFNDFRKAFDQHISGQNPQQVSSYAQKQLAEIKVDESLLYLYHHTIEFTSEVGDGLFEDMAIVVDVSEIALRVTGKKILSAALMPDMADATGKALGEDIKRRRLIHLLEQNAQNVQDYRISQLEKASRFGRGGESELGEDEELSSGFTLTQQALAFHFLLKEGLEITGVDQTKNIALAHLLAAKKIPIKGGKENIANSGIKSAFGKMWQKSDKGLLGDLRFVLRFFKAYEDTTSAGVKRILAAIEAEVVKVEARLKKEQDKR
ncbi:MAG: hypothetical protein JST06_07090 [Bacteroidetes bacterium]|nr:hypothetical protein [Bacteroidota bacterium]